MGRRHLHTTLSSRHSDILEELKEHFGTRNRVIEMALEEFLIKKAGEGELPEELCDLVPGETSPHEEESSFLEQVIRSGYSVLSDEMFRAVVNYEEGDISQAEASRVFEAEANRVAAMYSLFSEGGSGRWSRFRHGALALERLRLIRLIKVDSREESLAIAVETLNDYPSLVEAWLVSFFEELGFEVEVGSPAEDTYILSMEGTRRTRRVDA